MSLVTRCPKCQNDFLVTLEQLRMHDGLVRCGNCSNIFDGSAHLESDLPTLTRRAHGVPVQERVTDIRPDIIPTPVHESYVEPALSSNEPFLQDYPEKEPEPSVLRQRGQAGYASALSPTPSHDEPALSIHVDPRFSVDESLGVRYRQPEFLTDSDGPGLIVRIFWGVACLFAVIALLAQSIYIYRNDIATRLPFVQPVLNSLCAKLNCDVSLSRHLERISIDASSLQQSGGQTQEGQPVELSLRFTMRNRYDKNQPWPHLSLELKDASGTTVVRKIIAPYQYLPSTLVDQPFSAGQEVNLLIPIMVNGLQINGFQLDKFFP